MRKLLVLALMTTACLRLDVFVYFSKPVDDPNADLLADSVVPQNLREEIKTQIVSADGTIVNAYLLKHAAGDGTDTRHHGVAVLYAHGQSNNIRSAVGRLDLLWGLGYTVLAYDGRGDGKTPGSPTEETRYADARAAREWLETKSGFDENHVVLYGRSLGSLFVTKLAAERPPKALLLESPVLSIQQIIDDSITVDTPAQWYVDSLMNNADELPKFTGALLIMHGDADDYVAYANGQKLHELAEGHAKPNEFWTVPGADHGNVPCKNLEKAATGDRCAQGPSDDYAARVSQVIDTAVAGP